MVAQLIQKQFSEDKNTVFGIKRSFIQENNKEKLLCELNKYHIKHSMSSQNVYELPKNMGFDINLMEIKFSEIESKYKKDLEELILKIKNRDSFKQIKNKVNSMMTYFLIFYFRTFQFIKANCIDEDEKINRFISTLWDNNYIKELSKTIIANYNMYILESLNEYFLLSDSFLCTASNDYKGVCLEKYCFLNRSIGLKNITILIPLSSKYYILFTDVLTSKKHYIRVYKNGVFEENLNYYNSIIYRNSSIFTIGKYEYPVREVFEKVNIYSNKNEYIGNGLLLKEIWTDINIDHCFYFGNINKLKASGFIYYEGIIEQNILNFTHKKMIDGFRIISHISRILLKDKIKNITTEKELKK